MEQLTELKVLNLAGNLIRKVTGVQNLGCVEELNLRCCWKHKHRQKFTAFKKNVQEEQDTDDGGLAVGAQPAETVNGQQFIIILIAMMIIMIILFIAMMITMIIEGTCQTMRSKG